MNDSHPTVSREYLDHLCDELMAWVNDPESMTIPQFIQHKVLGYPYLKYFIDTDRRFANTFEFVKAILCNRWLEIGLTQKDLPAHKQKILLRYLRLYDSHAFDMEQCAKLENMIAERQAQINFIAENYAGEKLQESERRDFDRNVNKRRGREKT